MLSKEELEKIAQCARDGVSSRERRESTMTHK